MSQWLEAFSIALRQIDGEQVEFPSMKARFYEGTLFKTPRVASKWEAKHMELENGKHLIWRFVCFVYGGEWS